MRQKEEYLITPGARSVKWIQTPGVIFFWPLFCTEYFKIGLHKPLFYTILSQNKG
jgi:hypothetical protein